MTRQPPHTGPRRAVGARSPKRIDDATAALIAQLADPAPTTRRQAAIALGKSRGRAVVAALVEALAGEGDGPVRASLILALGVQGGAVAAATLQGLSPDSPAEAEALAKALDRQGPAAQMLAWAPGARVADLRLEVVEGLELAACRMAAKDGLPPAVCDGTGLLRLTQPVVLADLWPPPRWSYGVRLQIAAGTDIEAMLDRTAEGGWRDLLAIDPQTPPRYRFGIEGRKIGRELHQDWLRRVRAALAPMGAIDSPSRYGFEIILSFSGDDARLFLRPAMAADPRFSYRLGDVGASMNPVVAATLARLVPWPLAGAVLDPTSGSGTLLVERAQLAPDAPLIGLDISPTAQKVAAGNLAAAGLADRLSLRQGDARAADLWSPCGLVIANLPFGIRVGRDDGDLDGLYRSILQNAAQVLSPEGRVLLATANRGALERAIAAVPALGIRARHRFQSGGLFVQVAVLGLGRGRAGTSRRR